MLLYYPAEAAPRPSAEELRAARLARFGGGGGGGGGGSGGGA